MIDELGLVRTIRESDLRNDPTDDLDLRQDSSESDEDVDKIVPSVPSSKKSNKHEGAAHFSSNFKFDVTVPRAGDTVASIFGNDDDWVLRKLSTKGGDRQQDLDGAIATKRAELRRSGDNMNDLEIEPVEDTDSDPEVTDLVTTGTHDVVKKKESRKRKREDVIEAMEGDDDDVTDAAVKVEVQTPKVVNNSKTAEDDNIEYEEVVDTSGKGDTSKASFKDMHLSRAVMKSLANMAYEKPTPIQRYAIPVALAGKDVCACAATGTGKTAAYLVPALERLQHRRGERQTRMLIVVPTRELAVQVFKVAERLSAFITHPKIAVGLCAGGLDVRSQESALRHRPDIVVATPGRLIDLLGNTPEFSLHTIELLVLDEADRLLDEHFTVQLKEIIRQCARTRQTLLFSATMTEKVKHLSTVSLTAPVRIFVHMPDTSASSLVALQQEFIRVRRENEREALLAALLLRTFHEKTLIFVQTKRQAHRLHVLLGLLGVHVAELHGSLSQTSRLASLTQFSKGAVQALVATDVAARGLDVPDVRVVINFTLPSTLAHYIHRIGRTARAGKTGRAVSLVGESERKQLKEIVKMCSNKKGTTLKNRVIPGVVIAKFRTKLDELDPHIDELLKAEFTEKALGDAERKLDMVERTMEGRADDGVGGSRVNYQQRKWFQTKEQRRELKEKETLIPRDAPGGGRGKKTGPKFVRNKPLTSKQRKKAEVTDAAAGRALHELSKVQAFQARLAKKGKAVTGKVAAQQAKVERKKKSKQAENDQLGLSGSIGKSAFRQDRQSATSGMSKRKTKLATAAKKGRKQMQRRQSAKDNKKKKR